MVAGLRWLRDAGLVARVPGRDLGRGDDRVVLALELEDGAGFGADTLGGGAFGVGRRETGQRADQAVSIARLEVMGGGGEAARIGDAVVGRGCLERAVGSVRCDRAQRGPAARGTAADHQPGAVRIAG